MKKVLIIGACGQLGTELTLALRDRYGLDNVIASDLTDPIKAISEGPFVKLNALDREALERTVKEYAITEIYHLAAILSAKGEQNPQKAWDINMQTLLNVLEIGRGSVEKIYWPSSIAVFGPDTPKDSTPQKTIMNPTTVYGISKLAGERWCEYYFRKYGVDVRSLRYPGLIGYKAKPGGGTTDYAVDIFVKLLSEGKYTCFLKKDSRLPMMYMDDAVRATLELMEADADKISIRTSYNLSGVSFSPEMLYDEIVKQHGAFDISYEPDFRQAIADSWPNKVDDSIARTDWGWKPSYDLEKLTTTMLKNLEDSLILAK